MKIFKRLLRWFPQPDISGAELEGTTLWEISAVRDAAAFVRSLPLLFPESAYICFQGTTERRFETWLSTHAVPEPLKISPGTIWPKSDWYHIPLRSCLMNEAADIIEKHGIALPSIHVHIHDGKQVLLQWYDAFCDDPILISETFDARSIAAFVDAIGARGFVKRETDTSHSIEQ